MFHPHGPGFWELAEQALSSTERGYDLLAPKFDYTPFRTPDSLLLPTVELVRELGPWDRILDLCCGTGAALRAFTPHCRSHAVGIDFSQGMLDVAQQLQGDGAPGVDVQLIRGNVMQLPFEAEFDLAFCFGALGHIPVQDERRFVEQVRNSLRRGGKFLIVTAYRPPIWSWGRLLSHAFNGAMRVRNWMIKPPFIMYYLTFLVPQAVRLLEEAGFAVEVRQDVYQPPFQKACLIVATKT